MPRISGCLKTKNNLKFAEENISGFKGLIYALQKISDILIYNSDKFLYDKLD